MDFLTIVRFTSYALAFVILLLLPIRYTLFSKKTGKCLLALKKVKATMYIIVISFSLLMLVVLYFRDFSSAVALVLHSTALLALEMGSRELLYRAKAGVYEFMLVVDGRVVKKDEVVLLPTLEYETETDETLTIVTESRGSIVVFFESKKERDDATQIVKHWQKK